MITTKNIQDKKPKELNPGNHLCRIYDIQLKSVPYGVNAYDLVLSLEGAPLGEGFEGFFIDKDDESKGRFAGQVGRVRASQYAFEDKTLPSSGQKISRDQSILRIFIALAKAMDKVDQMDLVEADTIEDFVEKAKGILIGSTYIPFCIAGRSYEKGGYTRYDLFLPKPKGDQYSFAADKDSVIPFDRSIHIIASKKSKPLDEFAPSGEDDTFTV